MTFDKAIVFFLLVSLCKLENGDIAFQMLVLIKNIIDAYVLN